MVRLTTQQSKLSSSGCLLPGWFLSCTGFCGRSLLTSPYKWPFSLRVVLQVVLRHLELHAHNDKPENEGNKSQSMVYSIRYNLNLFFFLIYDGNTTFLSWQNNLKHVSSNPFVMFAIFLIIFITKTCRLRHVYWRNTTGQMNYLSYINTMNAFFTRSPCKVVLVYTCTHVL